MGKFKAHTKGIGLKLMKKIGFKEGSGLGENEQGIVARVEAKLHPKNMGIGFNGYKEAKLPVLDEAPKEKMATQVVTGPSKEKRWLKQKRGRAEAEILTMDEPLAKKQEQDINAVQKVLDMMGPQVEVLMSLDNLNMETEMKENDVPTPELLQYNVRQIVESTELDIQKSDQWHRKQLHVMESIALVVEKIKADSLFKGLTLDSLLTTFKDLKEIFERFKKKIDLKEIKECPPKSLNAANIANDAISLVFGKESRGRVQEMGFRVTPSKNLSHGDIIDSTKCKLLHWSVHGVIAEGRIASTDPKVKVHHVPVNGTCWKVWIDRVDLIRPNDEMIFLKDAIGSTIT
ncbi:septin and tuftelin-interacting protein 1 homolog 1-like [Zingiber officinale]|uniref:septin and tuftelin-interacting protein 1 homolog 1-like n=1 Tax=Zingiber officinale TaxID=94328 RepID=UPI001C4C33E9|nr:septin and tuftelin-interacting protein 1 homolog 1-like [Zingiber officinale]